MSTPLVRMTRQRKADKAMRRLEYAKADAAIPLVYLAQMSGRPGQFTIGLTTTNADGTVPRLGDHQRGAGKVTRVIWVKGARETELRLHNEFRPECIPDEPSWFQFSERAQGYFSYLETVPSMATDNHLAAGALDYLRCWPQPDGRLGQVDIFGNVELGGYMAEDLDDYQTPPLIAEAARLVLGKIDLDPATSERANNEVIHAARFHTAENHNDGLIPEWHATSLWLNPPWSQDGRWARKLAHEHAKGRVQQAILALGDTSLSKSWWADFGPYPLAQQVGRTGWRQWDGKISPPCGGVFLFLGTTEGERRFHSVFSCVGHVYGKRKMTAFRGNNLSAAQQWDDRTVRDFWNYWGERI